MRHIMREEQQSSVQVQATAQRHKSSDKIISPHWFEGIVTANGIQQHYYRTGGDKPSLMLLHGFSENGQCWSRVAKALEQDYDVIMVDARGHGQSSGPERGYSQDILTEDVIGLIHELKLQRPYLFGYSNGTLTAGQVAATSPELVRAVILEDPPLGEASMPPSSAADGKEPWPGFTAWYDSWIAWHKALRSQTPEERIASSQQFLPPGAGNWPEEDLLTHLEAQAQFNLEVLNVVPLMPKSTPWLQTVERIECPMLLLTSNSQLGAGVTQEAKKIADVWQKSKQVSFAEASHFMHHEMQGERFDHFISVVKAFLNES
jgi:N-formylmaleamate deformylase